MLIIIRNSWLISLDVGSEITFLSATKILISSNMRLIMNSSKRATLKLLGGAVAGFALAPTMRVQAAPSLQEKRIDSYLEKARSDWRAPGLAVAIVRDGETIYSKGFGVANVDSGKKTDEKTMFGVASTTKAFTSAGIAMLVDEKILDWDTPVREYLPSFQMGAGDAYASCNLRDLMSHRSGLSRHELLWYNNQSLTREKLLSILPYLAVFAPIRAKYAYNNLTVMLAGHALEKVAGQAWEDFTQKRIFDALGMKNSSTTLAGMVGANCARGHRLNEKKAAYSIPLRPEDPIGPAGAINSCVEDYAEWIKLQLGKGTSKKASLFSKSQSNQMWEPLIAVGAPSSPEFTRGFYGLGWRTDTYRGLTRVAHGGNLNGFASRVSLFPDKNIGIVAFTNLGGSPLPGHVTLDVLDMLLEMPALDWSAKNLAKRDERENAKPPTPPKPKPNKNPSHEFSEFVGHYFDKGYGDLFVEFDGKNLKAKYNNMPMILEHWHYDVFNAINERSEDFDLRDIKFVFNTNEAGDIASVSAKMDEATPPIQFIRK